MSERASQRAKNERADAHLADIEDGSGCTEIWEHLSERREREAEGAEPADRAEPESATASDDADE
jgi:hypothetical protein